MGLHVYILKCSDNSFYVGVTNNVDSRVLMHNEGQDPTSYTYSRRPVLLAWQNYFQSNMEAIHWEKKLKGWTKRKKQTLIEGKFEELHEFSKCLNDTNHGNHASTPLSMTGIEKNKINTPQ